MKTILKLVLALSRITPDPVIILFYQFIFFVNKPLLALFGGATWYRNSLYYKEPILGLSDFDLTLYLERKPDQSKVTEIKFLIKLLKVTMGRLGEIAIYCEEDLHHFVKLANPVELNRDPFFKDIPKASQAQKLCFFMRMLWADQYNLNEYLEFRVKKWRYLLKLLNPSFKKESLTEKNIKSIIKEEFYKIADHEQFSLRFFDIFEGRVKAEDKRDQLICHDKIWIHYHDLQIDTEWDLNLLKEQIKWEVWGVYNQRHFVPNKEQLTIHKKNLENICDKFFKEAEFLKSAKSALSLL